MRFYRFAGVMLAADPYPFARSSGFDICDDRADKARNIIARACRRGAAWADTLVEPFDIQHHLVYRATPDANRLYIARDLRAFGA
jgi:hypothetical protein